MEALDKLLKMTKFNTDESANRFANKLRKEGIDVILNETRQTMHGYDAVDCPITEEAILNRIENE